MIAVILVSQNKPQAKGCWKGRCADSKLLILTGVWLLVADHGRTMSFCSLLTNSFCSLHVCAQ